MTDVIRMMAAEGITKQDIMAIRPILRTWIGGGWHDGPQLARLLAKHEQTLAKFKPSKPVKLWRNERTPSPSGHTGVEMNNHGAEDQYTRPTAWSFERMAAETYASGTGRTLVTALVPPEDIYCSIPLVDYWCSKLGLKPIDEHRQSEMIVKPNPSFLAQIRRPVARKDEQTLRQELEQAMLAAYLPELAKAQEAGKKVISEQELRQRISGAARDTHIEDLPEKIREWQGRKVASAFCYGVTAAFTYKPKREWKDYTLVLLDVDKVEASYSKDENFYVGPQGAGGIGTRYQRFQQWLEDNPNTPIDPPMIGLTPSKTIIFGDGRHRWAVLRDMGEKHIPALVPREDLKVMQEKFGAGSGEAKVASKTLYHGTSLARAKKIMQEGLEPQVGSLVQTAYGDEGDYDFEPLAFAADKQGINRGVYSAMLHAISAEGHDTTDREQAIRNYGAIVVLKDGEDQMEHRPDGEGAEFDYTDHPLQVETGDYYSREGLVPDYVITGPALVRFFKRNGGDFLHRGLNPKRVNALIGMVKKAHPGLDVEKIVEKVWSLSPQEFSKSWTYYSNLPTSKAASIDGVKFVWKTRGGSEDNPHLLGAFKDGQRIGLMKWEDGWGASKGVSWLFDVKLDEEYQGQGIGKAMYLEAFKHLKSLASWAVSATPITPAAQAVWKSLVRDGIAQEVLLHGDTPAYGVELHAGDLPEAIVKTSSYDDESETIKGNASEAKKRHKFKPGKFTFPNGHPRCLICGDEENMSGWCSAVGKTAHVQIVYHGGQGEFEKPKRMNGILWATPDQHVALNYSNTYWRKGPSSLWAIQLNPSSRIVALWDLNVPIIRKIKDQVSAERRMTFGEISDEAWSRYADFGLLETSRWITEGLKKAKIDAVWVRDTSSMTSGSSADSLAILSDRAITSVTRVTPTVPKASAHQFPEIEFLCVNSDHSNTPTEAQHVALFKALSGHPGVYPYRQDNSDEAHTELSLAVILTDKTQRGWVLRQAKALGVPVDLEQMVSERKLNEIIRGEGEGQITKTSGLSAFNVNDSEFPWTQWILEGKKTIETRNSPSLSAHLGERVGIIRTGGRGPAALVGYCVLGQPKVYRSNEEFRADDALHLVPQGSGFDIPPGGVKYGYPISNVEPCPPKRVDAQGRVWRRLAALSKEDIEGRRDALLAFFPADLVQEAIDEAPARTAALKVAKPTDALLTQRYKATPEELAACKLVDDGDYLEWVVKAVKKDLIKLPEDGPKVKEWLERFTKLKRSPRFTGNKDINAYTPAKLFQTVQESAGAVSVKEEKREIVQAAEVWSGAVKSPVLRDVQVAVYKITDPKNAALIAGGPSITPEGVQQPETGWCTVDEETAASYLEKGPLWVIKVNGKNYCQIHVESDQMMDANDENIRDGFGVPGVSVRIQIINDPIVVAAIKGAHIPVRDAIDDGTPGTPLQTAKEIMGAIKGPTSIKDMGTEMPKITPEQLQILMTAPTICATVWIATLGHHWPPMLSYFVEHFDQCREALTRYFPVGRLQQADADYLIANPSKAMQFVYRVNARIGGGLGAKYYATGRGRQEGTPEDAQMVAVQRAMLAAEPERFVDMEAKKFFDCWWNPLAPEFMKAVTALKTKLSPYQILGWLRWLGYHKEVLASFPPGGLTDQQQEDLLASGGYNITEDAITYWAKMGQPIPAFFARAIREGQSDIPTGYGETPEQAAKLIYDKALGELAHA